MIVELPESGLHSGIGIFEVAVPVEACVLAFDVHFLPCHVHTAGALEGADHPLVSFLEAVADSSPNIPRTRFLRPNRRPKDRRRHGHFQNLLIHGGKLVLPWVKQSISANLLLPEEFRIRPLVPAKRLLVVSMKLGLHLPRVVRGLPGEIGAGCKNVPPMRVQADVLASQLAMEVQGVHAWVRRHLCQDVAGRKCVVRREIRHWSWNAKAVIEETSPPPDPTEGLVKTGS
mmetsp:Transcript_24427/g.55025  ORF Transcript_24427/g.55025 Transcript_24427/m.55025 type:complete len:230 (+) Transcript_24427:96-785(+)